MAEHAGTFDALGLSNEVEVVVIGGGFGGLLAGAKLRDAGVADIRLIEKGFALFALAAIVASVAVLG